MAGKRYVLNEGASRALQQMLRRGPTAPFTREKFREAPRKPDNTLIPVDAQVTGGSALASPANWRYTLRRAQTSEILLDDIDPTAAPHRFQRPPFGLMAAAKAGFVVVTLDPQPNDPPYLVWDLNEVPTASTCATP